MPGHRTLLALAAIAVQAPTPVTVAVEARRIAPGELVVLTIATHEPAGAVHVRVFEQDWPAFAVDDRTWRAIVGVDLDVAPGQYRASIRVDSRSGAARHGETITVEPKTYRTRTLTVDPAFVNPPEAVQARIAAEAAELTRLWHSSHPVPLWTGGFGRPVPQDATSQFGTRSIFNGKPLNPHAGADFPSPAGTAVASPSAGRVLLARDLYYTGGSVVVDHGAGLVSLFAHLSRVDVAAGDRVEAGQTLGRVGATGRVTGAHLHWTLRVSGARVDPLSLLQVLGTDQAPRRHDAVITRRSVNPSIVHPSINHQSQIQQSSLPGSRFLFEVLVVPLQNPLLEVD